MSLECDLCGEDFGRGDVFCDSCLQDALQLKDKRIEALERALEAANEQFKDMAKTCLIVPVPSDLLSSIQNCYDEHYPCECHLREQCYDLYKAKAVLP